MNRPKKIWISPPHLSGEEMGSVMEAINSNWIAPIGPSIDLFELELSTYMDGANVVTLNSGTSAIHLALLALGVGKGDLVICQSFTFAASANPIYYVGALPVFIDSEKETWNMSPNITEEAIIDLIAKNRKPKAIIVVHGYGMPAKMSSFVEISNTYDIPIIEDAAEALGSEIEGESCGSLGDIGILSFNGNKIITTSAGGALVTNNTEFTKFARSLSNQAKIESTHYEHSAIGYNYRISNICAAIGVGQMKVLDLRVQQRRANFDYYYEQLNDLPGLSFLKEPEGHFSNRWLTAIIVDSKLSNGVTRERLRLTLEADNIESRPLWKPLHLQPVFKYAEYYGSGVAEDLFQHGLCLPSGSNLTKADLVRIVKIIRKVFEGANSGGKDVLMSRIA